MLPEAVASAVVVRAACFCLLLASAISITRTVGGMLLRCRATSAFAVLCYVSYSPQCVYVSAVLPPLKTCLCAVFEDVKCSGVALCGIT